MALNSNLTYSIHVDTANATATVRDLNGQIVKTKVPISDLNKEFGSLTATIANNSQMASGNIVIHKNSEVALQNEIRVLNTLKSSLDVSSDKYVEMGNKVALLEQKLKTLRTGGVSASGGLKQMETASGGATSAVLELGRVVQDAPYGIRGMANNITQLASQMAFATKTSGSFKGALKDMGKAMMGPLGIVFAISVVVSLLDGFFGGMKKAEEQADSFSESLESNVNSLNSFYSELMKTYSSIEQGNELMIKRNNILSEMAELDKGLSKILEDTSLSEDERNKRLKEYIESIGLENQIKLLQKKLNEEVADTEKDLIILRELANDNKGTSLYWSIQDRIQEIENKRLSILEKILKIREKLNALTSPKAREGTVDWYKEEIKKE